MPVGVPLGTIPGPAFLLACINYLAKSMCKPCCRSAAKVKVAGLDLEDVVRTTKARSSEWNPPLNLVKCQKLASRGEHRGNRVNDIMEVSQADDLL